MSTLKNPAGILLFLALSVAVAAAAGCGRKEEPREVILEGRNTGIANPVASARSGAGRLRVAIAAMVSPKETLVSYNSLMEYIGKKLGREVDLIQRKRYEEVNDLVRDNQLDIAFVCTGAYVKGHDEFGMELLVAPVTNGETFYYSYTIVPNTSPVRSMEGLQGKTFAFTDPLSNTGKLVPTYRLALMRRTPERFFGKIVYTYSHDKSIEAVARNQVDGAAVDSLVWDSVNRKNPEQTSRTRIIEKSEPYGIPPVVVSRAAGTDLKRKLRDLFLRAHDDEEGRKILSEIQIERFVVVSDNIYDSVRAMEKWIREHEGK